MLTKQIQNIIIHTEGVNFDALNSKISNFHCDIIEQRINHTNLSTAQKIEVIDRLIDALKE